MAISGDVFRINQVYELLQEGQWPLEFYQIQPPPLGNVGSYGWYNNSPSATTVDRIDFAADTGAATVRGPSNIAVGVRASTGNDNYGWFGGGFPGPVSTVNRIEYSIDNEVASTRGPLSLMRNSHTSTGNANFGWFAGGQNPFIPSYYSRVDRIDFAADTAIASIRAILLTNRHNLFSVSNNNFGWFAGGNTGAASFINLSSVNRIDFAADTGTVSVRGPLSLARGSSGTVKNNDYGWFAAGSTFTSFSRVDRITFAADTGTASVRGPLSVNIFSFTGTNDNNYGWFGGGHAPAFGARSTVERINFNDDTIATSIRGPLSYARSSICSTSRNV